MTGTPHAVALFALAAALTLAPCRAPRAEGSAAPDAGKGFRRVPKVREDAPPDSAAFEFEANGFNYHVAANGNGRRTKGDRTRRFNLRLEGRNFIEGLRLAVYEGDLLLLCELYDGEEHTGLFTRLEQPSMRALWSTPFRAAAPGEPLRDGHDLYVSAADFVARLDLRTGEFVWLHDALREDVDEARGAAGGGESRPFGPFETPELAGDAVLFRERAVYNQRRTAVFQRKTGKIIRIE